MKLIISVEINENDEKEAFDITPLIYKRVKNIVGDDNAIAIEIQDGHSAGLQYSSGKLRPENIKRVQCELEYGKYKEVDGYHKLYPYILFFSYLEQKVDVELAQRVFCIGYGTAREITKQIIEQVCIDGKRDRLDNVKAIELLKKFDHANDKPQIPTYQETSDALYKNVMKAYDPELVLKVMKGGKTRAELFKTIKPEEITAMAGQCVMIFTHKLFGDETLKLYGESMKDGFYVDTAHWRKENEARTGYTDYFGEVDKDELEALLPILNKAVKTPLIWEC